MDRNAELKVKKEKLEKMKRDKLMRERNKEHASEKTLSDTIKGEQLSIDQMIKRAEAMADEANQKDKETRIKQKIEMMVVASPLKGQMANTMSSFVGEVSIPPKIKYAMYEVSIQVGDDEEEPGAFSPTDDAERVPPQVFESPPSIRKVTKRQLSLRGRAY